MQWTCNGRTGIKLDGPGGGECRSAVKISIARDTEIRHGRARHCTVAVVVLLVSYLIFGLSFN